MKAFRWKWSVHGVGLAMAIGFLIGSSALVPGGLLNNPNSPPKFKYGPPTEHLPPPPDELGGRRGQRCNIPGTVQNDSSHVIYLKGDVEKENGDLVEEFYNLQPGQFSTVHNCDIDYIASQHVTWQWGDIITVQPNWWSSYIFNMRIRCVNHTLQGNSTFRCYGIGLNWEEQ